MAVSGASGTSGSNAAAIAARQAEEARRRAEEARRRAEAARERARKAQEAQKKAQEAQKKAQQQAQQAQRELQQTRAKLQPKEKPKPALAAELKQKEDKLAAARAELDKANARLQAAEEKVVTSANEAEDRMREANALATAEGKKPPFAANELRKAEVTSAEAVRAFEGASPERRAQLERELGVKASTNRAELQQSLTDQRQFEKLQHDPGAAATLEALEIRNGEDLRGFGERIAREANGELRGLEPLDLDGFTDTKSLSKVIQGAGGTLEGNSRQLLQSKEFADKVAGGESITDAAKGRQDLTREERAATRGDARQGLDELGVSQEQFQRLNKGDQRRYLEAARSTADGDYQSAVQSLAQTGPGAEKAITAAAANLEPADSPEARLLTNESAVKDLLATGSGRTAVGELADGNLVEGLRALDGKAPRSVTDAISSDPKIQEGLEELGLDPTELGKAGKALPDLVAAATTDDPQRAIDSLTDAARANPALRSQVTDAIVARAEDLPPGAERNILSDRKLVESAIKDQDGRRVLDRVARGDTAVIASIDNKEVRSRAIDAAASDPEFKAAMEQAQVTAAQLKKMDGGLDNYLRGIEEISGGNTEAGLEQMVRGAQQDPAAREAAAKSIPELAQTLPDRANGEVPAWKQALTDPKQVKALLENPDGRKALSSLVAGDTVGAIDQLGSGKGTESLRDGLIGKAWNDPAIREGFDKLGLTRAALDKSDGAAADLTSAGLNLTAGNKAEVLQDLNRAYDAGAKTAARAAIDKFAGLSPEEGGLATTGKEGQLRTLLQDKKTTDAILADPKLNGAWSQLSEGRIGEALNTLGRNDQVRDQVIGALGRNEDFRKGLENLGLSTAELKSYDGAALDDLYNATDLAADVGGEQGAKGDFQAAMQELRDAARTDPQARQLAIDGATKYAGQALEGTDGNSRALKRLMQDPKFVGELLTNPKLDGAFDALTSNDLIAGLRDTTTAPDAAKSAIDALARDPGVKEGLDALGISPTELKDPKILKSFPDFIGASISIGEGKPLAALDDLARAYGTLPEGSKDFAVDALQSLSETLEDDGLQGMAKTLLADPSVAESILGDGSIADAFSRGDAGDIPGGLAKLFESDTLAGKAADVLLANPRIKSALDAVGLGTKDELLEVRDGIAGVGNLIGALQEDPPDLKGALMAGGEILDALPDDKKEALLDKVVDGLGDRFRIPEQIQEVIRGAAGILTNAEAMGAFSDAIEAFKDKDPQAFIQHLAAGGKALAGDPALAETFLNALGNLPGTVGKFFQDEELNAAIAETGAVESVFGAVEKLAENPPDLVGALGELGGAMKELLSAGDPIGVKIPPFGPRLEIDEIGDEGLQMMGKLFGKLFDALPENIQSKIQTKAASFVGNFANPISGIKNGIEDAGQLISAIQEGDALDIAINAGQLVTDVGSIIPAVKPFAQPLQFALGVAETVKNANDLVTDAQAFARDFTGIV